MGATMATTRDEEEEEEEDEEVLEEEELDGAMGEANVRKNWPDETSVPFCLETAYAELGWPTATNPYTRMSHVSVVHDTKLMFTHCQSPAPCTAMPAKKLLPTSVRVLEATQPTTESGPDEPAQPVTALTDGPLRCWYNPAANELEVTPVAA